MRPKIKKVVFDKSFEKRFEKYKEGLSEKDKEKLKEKLKIFQNNPFNPQLKTHKLKGKLQNYWVFSISYSERMLFRFFNNETVFFIDIGNHSIYH